MCVEDEASRCAMEAADDIKEGSGVKSRKALIPMRGKDEAKPSKPVPVTSMPAPMRSRRAEEANDSDEEPWHDAREECTKADDGRGCGARRPLLREGKMKAQEKGRDADARGGSFAP